MRIGYWIQRADFSATDYDPVDTEGAKKAIRTHDWRQELEEEKKLTEKGENCCPPGIGFVSDDKRILHVCPKQDGFYLVHYHYKQKKKLLGLIPISTDGTSTIEAALLPTVEQIVDKFFNDDHEGIIHYADQTST